jgi:hypothetical protein
MDNPDTKEIQDLERAALEKITSERKDPRQQTYFKRLDTQTVVKSEKEYTFCQNKKIQMALVSYNQAFALLMQEDAGNRNKIKKIKKRKAAKKARKRNRNG